MSTARHTVILVGAAWECRHKHCRKRGDLAWAIRHAVSNQYDA